MKKLILMFLMVFVLVGCEEGFLDNLPNIDDPIDEVIPEEGTPATKNDVLNAIYDYKQTLYNLGATPVEEVSSFTMLETSSIISSDQLIPTYASVGLDLEWLEMSVMILNFSEAVTMSDYQLNDITLIAEVLTDTSMWGWPLYDESTVMISYIEETLMMRVTSSNGPNNIQTFYYSYNDEGEIEILRFDEVIINERQDLYVEDFVENTGLTVWNNESYSIMTSYETSDGGTYVISKDNEGNQRLVLAQYDINGVNVSIYNATENGATVDYDLSSVEIIDGFDLEGNVYFETSLLTHELETTLYSRPSGYMLYGRKMLTDLEDSLSVVGLGIQSDITLSNILTNINTLMMTPGGGYNRFNYGGDMEAFYESINDFSYYDYSNVEDRVEQEIIVTVDYQFDGKFEYYAFYPSNMMDTPNSQYREGYQLVGYALTPDGERIDFPYAFTENVTIYAIWEEIIIDEEPAIPTESIADAIAQSIDENDDFVTYYAFIPGVTILGITNDGVIIMDDTGILFMYGADGDDLAIGQVYDVHGVINNYYGGWQLGAGDRQPIIFIPSSEAATPFNPTVSTSVNDILSNTHIPDATNRYFNYEYYEVTAKVVVTDPDSIYGTFLTDVTYTGDGSDFTVDPNSAQELVAWMIHYQSNYQELHAFDGLEVTLKVIMYAYRTDRTVFTALFLGTAEDVIVSEIDENS